MISLENRQKVTQEIEQASQSGVRIEKACDLFGITIRTLQRWKAQGGLETGDRRPNAPRPVPSHALTEQERLKVLEVANSPTFADMPPSRIVPTLADQGQYLASESTFYRVLREHGQNRHRGRAKAPRKYRPPSTHVATKPGQLWCWDMTYLQSTVKGRFFYLYMILDVYSRKIVGWQVHDTDNSEHSIDLATQTALSEGIQGTNPVLHGDNGSTIKAANVLAMLYLLGIKPSHSRPRVSNDNAYAESFFRTTKYCVEYPVKGFKSLEDAQLWTGNFMHWYNFEHLHSGIGYVTPAQRHEGLDKEILEARHRVYTQAKKNNPRRWSGHTRDWSHTAVVTLNPERDSVIKEHLNA